MLDGPSVVAALEACRVSHVVWVPDTELGQWDSALSKSSQLRLIRACREGEAIVLAAGLHIGGAQPIVAIQCTGLFEAGDALRNVLHDLHLPLFFIIGMRSYYAHRQQATSDSCPLFTVPIVEAWRLPFVIFERDKSADDLAAVYRQARAAGQPMAVLLAE